MNQEEALSKKAQHIQAVLAEHGLSCRVVELASSTRTAQEAAASIGCAVAQIVKSLLFKTQVSHQPVLILVSGSNRVNEKAVSEILKEKIEKADAEYTRAITGFVIGGVPPIGHKHPITHIFIDEDLLQLPELWAAAGTPNAVFNIKPHDLSLVTKGKVIDLGV